MLNENVINKVFNDLTRDPIWIKKTKLNENWKDDPVFSTYHKLGNKQKGTNGEYVVEQIFKELGKNVVATRDSKIHKGTDFDMIVDGYKTEIKFSLANSSDDSINTNDFMINHAAVEKDWDRLVFFGVNPEGCTNRAEMYFVEKKEFKDYINSYVVPARATDDIQLRAKIFKTCAFKPQQGGYKSLNDDYMCTDFKMFLDLPFTKEISLW